MQLLGHRAPESRAVLDGLPRIDYLGREGIGQPPDRKRILRLPGRGAAPLGGLLASHPVRFMVKTNKPTVSPFWGLLCAIVLRMSEQEKRLEVVAAASRKSGPRLALQIAPLSVNDREEALWIYEKALREQLDPISGLSTEVRDGAVDLQMRIVRDRLREIDAGERVLLQNRLENDLSGKMP